MPSFVRLLGATALATALAAALGAGLAPAATAASNPPAPNTAQPATNTYAPQDPVKPGTFGYATGYKQGEAAGYRAGQEHCTRERGDFRAPASPVQGSSDYAQGYQEGWRDGWRQGCATIPD